MCCASNNGRAESSGPVRSWRPAGFLDIHWSSVHVGKWKKEALIPARVSISGVGLATAVGEGGQTKLNSFSFGSLYIWATTRRGHLLHPSVNPPRKYTPRPAKKQFLS